MIVVAYGYYLAEPGPVADLVTSIPVEPSGYLVAYESSTFVCDEVTTLLTLAGLPIERAPDLAAWVALRDAVVATTKQKLTGPPQWFVSKVRE